MIAKESIPESALIGQKMVRPFPSFERLPAQLERQYGIEFRQLTKDEASHLKQALLELAAAFGLKSGLEVINKLPEKLVLKDAVTEEFQKHCDDNLGLRYANFLHDFEKDRDEMVVSECCERLVDLEKILPEAGVHVTFSNRPFHEACGEWAGKRRLFWVRSGVGQQILNLGKALNAINLMMHIEDGYRPPAVQAGLFKRRYGLVRQDHPDWTQADVLTEVAAKTARSPFCAAHMSGSALDFTLRSLSGHALPLGNDYPVGGTAAILDYPYLTAEQYTTRTIFKYASLMAGLWPYIGEDWHVSKGDGLSNLWIGERVIKYGALHGFKEDGTPLPYDMHKMRQNFSIE